MDVKAILIAQAPPGRLSRPRGKAVETKTRFSSDESALATRGRSADQRAGTPARQCWGELLEEAAERVVGVKLVLHGRAVGALP